MHIIANPPTPYKPRGGIFISLFGLVYRHSYYFYTTFENNPILPQHDTK